MKFLKFLFFISIISILSSCSEDKVNDLEGSWIWTLDDEIITEDDGTTYHMVIYKKYVLDKDEVTYSFNMDIDGKTVVYLSCQGTWEYEEGDFTNPDVKGIIVIDYNLSTFKRDFDEEWINEDYQEEMTQNFREELLENNNKNKNYEYRRKDAEINNYFGINIIDISKDELTIDTNDGIEKMEREL